MMRSALRSVLVIHPGSLGDVLLAVLAIQVIRSRFPNHEVALLAGSEVGHLLQMCGIVDQVLSIEAGYLATLFAGPQPLTAPLEDVITRCDLALGWLSDSDGSLRVTLQRRGIPRLLMQAPGREAACHQRERFLASVESLIGVCHRDPVGLTLPESSLHAGLMELKKAGLEEGESYVVCHPGSGSPHKCIRGEIFSDILSGCRDRALTPVIIVGPADENAVQALGAEVLTGISVIRPQDLTTLAGILARASGYVGHDSGVTHLAALLGVPTVAMFGPTDPRRWSPWGPYVSVIAGAECCCKGWDAVRACREKPCLNIQASDALHMLDGLLSRYRQVTNS